MNSPEDSSPSPTPAPTKPATTGKRGIFEDIVVTAFGMATSAAVAYGSYYAARQFNFAFYTWMANFIIPVGAIICGAVAAIGYWAGSRIFHHRPTRFLLLNMVLVSVGTFFSIHHLDYSHAYAGERPLSDVMPFTDYLKAVIEHMSYRTSSGDSGTPTELGMLGWGVAALQIAGFSLGGFIVYGMLTAIPYCDRCSKYFAAVWKRTLRCKDVDLMMPYYNASAQMLQEGHLQSALNEFAALPKQPRRAKALLTIDLRKCPTCENRLIKLTGQKLSGNNFVKVTELSVPTELPIVAPKQDSPSAKA